MLTMLRTVQKKTIRHSGLHSPSLLPHNVSAHNRFFKELILVVMLIQSFDTIVGGAGYLNFLKKS